MNETFLRAFARRFRARYQPLYELTTDMQVMVLRLARADMARLPVPHRCSA